MSTLLQHAPYAERDDERLLEELQGLHEHHRQHCELYGNITAGKTPSSLAELPFLHVGLFKHLDLRSVSAANAKGRTLNSSSTSGTASAIALDAKSSTLQSESSSKILGDFLGTHTRPLLILDSAKSLRQRNLSARVAAAMSLRFLASKIVFLLDDAQDPSSFKFEALETIALESQEAVLYGFSWVLWQAWAQQTFPESTRAAISNLSLKFVHSGGWKKLEAQRVTRDVFDKTCRSWVHSSSTVLDYYGLVEQIGIVYPLCEQGYRHVPRWADILVRDSYSLAPLLDAPGQIQLMNALAWGAPYHSVLTEDMGIIHSGPCDCGRSGKRFSLLGRVPKAEVRGCANV